MSRPKEKLSAAFLQKCVAAADKVRNVQADKLNNDMSRLSSDETHCDLMIQVNDGCLPLHKIVLKSRSAELYWKLLSFPHRSEDPCTISLPHCGEYTMLEKWMRSLYTDSDVSATLKTLLQNLDDLEDGSLSSGTHGLLTETSDTSECGQSSHTLSGCETDNMAGTVSSFPEENSITSAELQDEIVNVAELENDSVLNGSCSVKNPASVTNSNIDTSHVKTLNETLLEMAKQIIVEAIQKATQVAAVEQNTDGCDGIHEVVQNTTQLPRENAESNDSVIKQTNVQYRKSTNDTFQNTDPITTNVDSTNDNQCQLIDGSKTETQTQHDEVLDQHILTNKSNYIPSPVIMDETDSQLISEEINFENKLSCKPVSDLIRRVYSLVTPFTPCNHLGEDLLRILLQEVDCDCTFEVGSEVLHAHKCILSARSSYFDAMLSGAWIESGDGHIVLQGIEMTTMKQCLLYLYGGVIEIDATCNIGGLVMMADMYSMAGLKDVIAFNLNKDYCHFFHRPCPVCTSGVPETLALTMMYNMDVLKEKCVKWVNKNFDKVWPTKTFATLPQEVLEYCSSAAVNDLANNNVIDTLLECRRLNEKCPKLKWTEPIFDMITRLMDAAIEFASQNFTLIVCSNTFRKIDKQGIAFDRQPLEDIFGLVIASLSPENSCQAYLALNKWIMTFKALEEEKNQTDPLYTEEFVQLVEVLYGRCKDHLCMYVHQAANTVEWTLLNKSMQKDIMEAANYVCIDNPNRSRVARPKLTSMQKKITSTYPLSLKEYFDRHFGLTDVPPLSTDSKSKPASKQSKLKNGIPTQKAVPKIAEKAPTLEKPRPTRTIDNNYKRQAKTGSSSQKGHRDGIGAKDTKTLQQMSHRTIASPKTQTKSETSVSKQNKKDVKPTQQMKLNKPQTQVDSKNRNPISNNVKHEKKNNQKSANSTKEMKGFVNDTKESVENGCHVTIHNVQDEYVNEIGSPTNTAASSADQDDSVVGGASFSQNNDFLLASSHSENSHANDFIPSTNQNDLNVGGASVSQNSDFLLDSSYSADQSSPRRRAQSAGSATLLSQEAPKLRAARSVESVFGSGDGQRSSVDKLIPTLKVNFTIPHEFYESF